MNEQYQLFEDVLGMVTIGSGAQREFPNVKLPRYACYLVVQNGDPTKPVIAADQTIQELGGPVCI